MVENKSNSFGIASLVLGVASIIFFWLAVVGLVFGILGIVFYVKQHKRFPNGIATAGLVTSIIGTVLSALITIFWLFTMALVNSF